MADGFGSALDFRLVEIVDHEDLTGKKGQVVSSDGQEYAVATFDGDVISVAPAHLRELAAEDCDFDLVLPLSEYRRELFPWELAEILLAKGYCTVQMSSRPHDRKLALDNALSATKWVQLVPEFEAAYMGRSPAGKRVMWAGSKDAPALDDSEPSGLAMADQALEDLGSLLMGVAPAFGFIPAARTNALIHMARPASGEQALAVEAEEDVMDFRSVQDNLAFVHSRRLCLMYFVHGSGGTLTLHPADTSDVEFKIDCRENQVVVFRTDILDYTFEPDTSQVAVQAWVLRQPHAGETGLEAAPVDEKTLKELGSVPESHRYRESSETQDIMSIALHIGGSVWDGLGYWNMLVAGSDCVIPVPMDRWDHDLYWDENGAGGKAYLRHYGMVQTDMLTMFDHDFFGMTEEEALQTDPLQRSMMEVGTEVFANAGFTPDKLKGLNLAFVAGYAGSEFTAGVMRNSWGFGISREMTVRNSCAAAANRLHYIYGMKGPVATTETACSSSLTAISLMHSFLRPEVTSQSMKASNQVQTKFGVAGGTCAHFDPFYSMALCGASMLSHMGRCFTFDQSADGFARGEGTALLFMKCTSNAHGEDLAKLAVLCSSAMNQDGRSASLTAPHGPSQQECIRASLRESGIPPLTIQIQELHGTGTALGDPIEVGALRATMMASQGVVRSHPLVKTSSKSNLSHTEMCAGAIGMLKCMLLGMHAVAAPNLHLRLLNPHIDYHSYPVVFTPELVDQGAPTGYIGVSSFGFGGSNARGDIWARAQNGPRNTQPGVGQLDLSANRIQTLQKMVGGKEVARAEGTAGLAYESWGQLRGDYMTGDPMDPDFEFFVAGTFNGWAAMQKMHWVADRGAHCFAFRIGDELVEQFQILCNGFADAKIFPVSKMADADTLILGPGEAPPGHNWAIDVRDMEVAAGTPILVKFWWDSEAKQKRISWEPSDDPSVVSLANSMKYMHSYSLVASWNGYKSTPMSPVKGEPGVFKAVARIGLHEVDRFAFLRDGDQLQAVYPAHNNATSEAVPVRGPDLRGAEKYWKLAGPTGSKVEIRLSVAGGTIEVSTTASDCTRRWKSATGAARRSYFVNASWSSAFLPMRRVDRSSQVYKLEMTMSADEYETFQIVVDEDLSQTFHPDMENAGQLIAPVAGPDSKGAGLFWAIQGPAGAQVEITLDLSQTDRRRLVTWTEVAE